MLQLVRTTAPRGFPARQHLPLTYPHMLAFPLHMGIMTDGSFPFPAIDKSTLANGMRVWTVHHAQVPLVAFTLLVRRGAAADPLSSYASCGFAMAR